MTDGRTTGDWLREELNDPETSWSVGTFGAIAEFLREPDEPATIRFDGANAGVYTTKGGIRLDTSINLRPVAYETTNRDPEQWSHAVALCLPSDAAAMSGRTVLTELGPDAAPLREEDRSAILFDLGLSTHQVDVCIRTSDPALIATLRSGLGHAVFDHASSAMLAILAASPHRVFLSRVGRAEVYQRIPSPTERSPDGPHTHVLPKLLKSRQTHAATNPIPENWVPCAHLYPAHPAKDAQGQRIQFDQTRHERFQALLAQYGDPTLCEVKAQVAKGIAVDADPSSLGLDSRFARIAARVALRQLALTDGKSSALARWSHAHDRAQETVDILEEDPEHV